MSIRANNISPWNCIGLLALALSPASANAQPYAYVSNVAGNNVSVVNTASNSVVASVPVPAGPSGLAVTRDSAYIYVPEDGVETAKKALEVAGTKMPMKTRIVVEEPVAPQMPAGA